MADHKNKSDHYQTERQDAAQQNSGVDDAVNKAVVISPGSLSSPGGFGKTSFEGYDLNAMIDIVESANPETLENAATALVDARDAINDAANELSRNLGDVDWEGEAHTAFYTWGMNLTTTALALAGYTDEVGTQVLAASAGLASVRKSMPPRDSRIDPKKPEDIPTPKRVEGNEEYTAAVTAEKNRQEAINQMYRLASFYTVSSGMMELAEEPTFPKMPDVGVPEPENFTPIKEKPRHGSFSAASGAGTTRHHSVDTMLDRPGAETSQSSARSGASPSGFPNSMWVRRSTVSAHCRCRTQRGRRPSRRPRQQVPAQPQRERFLPLLPPAYRPSRKGRLGVPRASGEFREIGLKLRLRGAWAVCRAVPQQGVREPAPWDRQDAPPRQVNRAVAPLAPWDAV